MTNTLNTAHNGLHSQAHPSEQRNADDKGSEALLLRSGRRVLEIASVLLPPERALQRQRQSHP